MCGQSLLWRRLGPFCWSMLAVVVAVFSSAHQFAEHTSQMKWFHGDSESFSGSDGQQTTKQWPWPIFGTSLASESALELPLDPTTELAIAGYPLFIACHNQSRNSLLLLCRLSKDSTSKQWFFDFQSTHEAPAYWAWSFQFAPNAKWL